MPTLARSLVEEEYRHNTTACILEVQCLIAVLSVSTINPQCHVLVELPNRSRFDTVPVLVVVEDEIKIKQRKIVPFPEWLLLNVPCMTICRILVPYLRPTLKKVV